MKLNVTTTLNVTKWGFLFDHVLYYVMSYIANTNLFKTTLIFVLLNAPRTWLFQLLLSVAFLIQFFMGVMRKNN